MKVPKSSASRIVLGVTILLVVVRLILFVDSFSPHQADLMDGGDFLDIAPGIYTVRVERAIGDYRTSFVGVVQVEDTNVTMVKGYVRGSTGMHITVGGQSLGFGISTPEFWIEKETVPDDTGTVIYKVVVSYSRIKFLILNERHTMLVGTVALQVQPGETINRTHSAGQSNKSLLVSR